MPWPGQQTPNTTGINAGGNTNIDWLKMLVGAGAGLGSAYLQNRTQSQQNERLNERTAMTDAMAKAEQQKRDYFISILMPRLLQGMRQRNPQILAQAKTQMLAGGQNPYGAAPPIGGAASPPDPQFGSNYFNDDNFMGRPRNPYEP